MIGSIFKKYLFAAFEKRAPEINLRDSRNGRLFFFFFQSAFRYQFVCIWTDSYRQGSVKTLSENTPHRQRSFYCFGYPMIPYLSAVG